MLTAEYTKHPSLNLNALYTELNMPVVLLRAPNSNHFIQVCDWLTTLLPPFVKNAKCQLPQVKRCRSKLPSFLHRLDARIISINLWSWWSDDLCAVADALAAAWRVRIWVDEKYSSRRWCWRALWYGKLKDKLICHNG